MLFSFFDFRLVPAKRSDAGLSTFDFRLFHFNTYLRRAFNFLHFSRRLLNISQS
jgi:hypothetical protein